MKRRSTNHPLSKETRKFLWSVLDAIIRGDRTYSDGRTSFDFELLQHALKINKVEGLHDALRHEWERRCKSIDRRVKLRPKKIQVKPLFAIHYRSDLDPQWQPESDYEWRTWRDTGTFTDRNQALRAVKGLRKNAHRNREDYDDPWKLEFKIVLIPGYKPNLP